MDLSLGPVLDTLDDGANAPLVILAFSRAPFATHGTLHLVCRRLNTIISLPAFRQQRVSPTQNGAADVVCGSILLG